jgi:MFS transporter, ACS family, pantothenate transporter
MEAIGRVGKKSWTKEKVKGVLLSWHTYLLRKLPLRYFSTMYSCLAELQLTIGEAFIYIVWNNAYALTAMGYWLKSFNATPAPVPGMSYSIADINDCKANLDMITIEFPTPGLMS